MVDMPLRRHQRQYEQLSEFERGRIIGMMETGWSARRVARQIDRSEVTPRGTHGILLLHVLPLMEGANFQQENARQHIARMSQDCLHTITTLPWPARSPYLSPIEHN
ncbi:uncharacterized protein TNCV_1114411 [Trichonephila clavipes]|nr:uncharacterized protein TNCV_1114411 [Trichonephila clavipes]